MKKEKTINSDTYGNAKRLESVSAITDFPDSDIVEKLYPKEKKVAKDFNKLTERPEIRSTLDKLKPFSQVNEPQKLNETNYLYRSVYDGVLREKECGTEEIVHYLDDDKIELSFEEKLAVLDSWEKKV